MNFKPICLCLVLFILLCGAEVMALSKPTPLDNDCTPTKAAKNTAMKATVGVSGRCKPADAAKDSAKKAVGIDDHKSKKNDKTEEEKEGLLKKKRLLN